MPAPDVGLPCGVMENCPDAATTAFAATRDRRVHVLRERTPQAATPTLSCSAFDPIAALVACASRRKIGARRYGFTSTHRM